MERWNERRTSCHSDSSQNSVLRDDFLFLARMFGADAIGFGLDSTVVIDVDQLSSP